MKRKLYEEGALPASSEGPKKVNKKTVAAVAMATQGTPTVISVPAPQVVVASGLQGAPGSQPSLKKQKTAGTQVTHRSHSSHQPLISTTKCHFVCVCVCVCVCV